MVGIITDTDIFKSFVELLGGREQGLRLTLDVTEGKGALAAIANEIAREDGNIISLATFSGKDASDRIITVKVTGARKEALLKGLESQGVKVLNAIEISERGYEFRIIDENTRPFVE